jgi:hypothetical protein
MTDAVSFEKVAAERYDAEKYKSSYSLDSQYDLNQIQERVRGLPDKRITHLRDEGAFSFLSIDGAGTVRKVSDAFQKRQCQLWKNLQKGYENTITYLSAGAVVVLLAGGGYVVAAGYAPSMVSSLVLSIAGLYIGFSVLGIWHYCEQAADAKKQAQLWSQPSTLAQEMAEKRKAAYEKGFPYIYRENLKNTLLQPLEVKALYEEYFTNFCKTLDRQEAMGDQACCNWIEKFGSMNPLSLTLMKYGHGEVPQELAELCDSFEKFKSQIAEVKQEFEEERRLINGESRQHIQALEAEMARKIGSCQATLQEQLAVAKAKRDEVFDARHLERCPDCRAAEERLQFEMQQHQFDYATRVSALNTYLDREIEETLLAETRKLQGLRDEEIRDIQLKTDARIQVYKEEKADKLKSLSFDLQLALARAKDKIASDTEFEYSKNIQQVRDWEKRSLKDFSYEAITEIHKETDASITALERERQELLNRAQNSCSAAIDQARAQRDEVCKTFPDVTCQEYMQAETTYQFVKKQKEEELLSTSSQIVAMYDTKIQTEQESERKILKGLTREEAAKIKQEAAQLVAGLLQGKEKAEQEAYLQAKKECEAVHAQKVGFINAECENKTRRAFAAETERQRGLTREEIGQIKQATVIKVQSIQEKRAKELKPYADTLQAQNGQSLAIRDAVFNAHRQKAEQIYAQEKQHFLAIYSQNEAHITAAYNDRIAMLKGAKDEALKSILNKEVHAVAKHYGAARDLLAQAMSRKIL